MKEFSTIQKEKEKNKYATTKNLNQMLPTLIENKKDLTLNWKKKFKT